MKRAFERSLSGLQRQSLDASAQTALAAISLISVNQTFVNRGIDDRHSLTKSLLSLFDLARFNRQDDFLDEGAQTAAQRCIVNAIFFRSTGAFFCGSDICQGKTPFEA